jgi:hypothetical protein
MKNSCTPPGSRKSSEGTHPNILLAWVFQDCQESFHYAFIDSTKTDCILAGSFCGCEDD